ncbi:DUF4148 domain-containing protein [Alicycliphilus sp. T452]
MNKTLIAAALALGAIATAHADAPIQYGEGSYPGNAMQSQPSTLTREAVIADLVAARANGTMPRSGEWDDMAAGTASARTRAEVRKEAIEAAQASVHSHASNFN